MKRFIIFSFGSLLSITLMLLTTKLIHENLSKQELGNYYYYFNIITLVYPVFCISAFSLYLRFGVAKSTRDFVNSISVIGTLIFSLFIYIWSDDYRLSILSFIILFQCELCKMRYLGSIVRYNLYLNLQKVVYLLIIIFCFKHNFFDFNYLLFSLGITYSLVLLIMYFFKEKYYTNQEDKEDKIDKSTLFKYGLNASFLVFFNWVILVSDQVIIKNFLGSVELAPYAVAYKISTIITILSGIFMVYFPVIYFKEMKHKMVIMIFKLRALFIFTIISSTLLFLFCDQFIYRILGSSQYSDSSYLMKILLVSEVLRVSASIFLIFNSFILRLKYNFYLSLFIAFMNVSLNLIVIQKNGLLGVALVTFLCSFIYFVFSIKVYINERLYVRI